MLRTLVKICIIILLVLITIPATALLFLQNNKIQTRITNIVTQKLSTNLETKIEIEEVAITFFNRILLKEVYVEDLNGDTLLLSDKIKVTLRTFDRAENEFGIKRITLIGADIHLITTDSTGVNLNFIIDKLSNPDKPKSEKKKITFQNIQLQNSRFRLSGTSKDPKQDQIDFSELEVNALNIKVEDLSVYGDTVSMNINKLAFIEKTGFTVNNLSSRMSLARSYMYFENTLIETPSSSISAARINFDFNTFRDFSDFINEVNLTFNFRSSVLNFGDIGFFTNSLNGYDETFNVSGLFSGTINQLSSEKFLVAYNDHTILGGNLNLIGLPDIRETFMHLNLELFRSNMEDLSMIRLPGNKKLNIPENFSELGIISYEGKFTGYYDDFVAYGKFGSELGNISTDLLLKPDTLGGLDFSGIIKTASFKLGEIINNSNNTIGNISVRANVDGSIHDQKISANLKGRINNLDLYGYNYKNINLAGYLSDKVFDGSLSISDPNIQMDFNGKVDFSSDLPNFRFIADVGRLRPYFLNVSKTDPSYFASFLVKSDFTGMHPDSINGSINLVNSFFQRGSEQIQVYDFGLDAVNAGDSSSLKIRSDVLDADITGNYSLSTVGQSFINLGAHYLPSFIDSTHLPTVADVNEFSYSFEFKKIKNVVDFFLPEVILADNSFVSGYYDGSDFKTTLTGNFPELGKNESVWRDLFLIAETDSFEIEITGSSKSLFFGPDLQIDNVEIAGKISNDTVITELSWNNRNRPMYRGDLKLKAGFSENTESKNYQINIETIPSFIVFNDTLWNIPQSSILIDSTSMRVDSFSIRNKNQAFLVNGEISEKDGSALNMYFDGLDLATLNVFTHKTKLDLAGFLTGQASIINAYKNPLFLSALTMEEFRLNGENFGKGEVSAKWDNKQKGIHMLATGTRGGGEIFRFEGDFNPLSKSIDFDATFDKIRLSTFEPFAAELVSDFKGLGSGNFDISGTTTMPRVNGDLDLFKASVIVNYLQTRYSFTDKITLSNNNIRLKDFHITDKNGSIAVANGLISNRYFKDFNLDLNITSPEFLFLNTSASDNELFYGRVLASGVVKISGPPDNLFMDINATTGRNSVFSIPLNNAEEVNENNFIRFVDSTGRSIRSDREDINYEVNLRGLNMNFNLEITPDAEVQMIFDPKVGDILRGRGNGNLKMTITSLGEFEIYGEMIIEEGDYLFTLQNLINKKLEVKPGGRIVFNGDPADAIIDLGAVYKLRTSVYPLSPESGDELKKRIPVECQIKMTGKLMEPTINTEIELPTADQQTKNIVSSTINTEEEKLKQFISLLVINNFMSIDPGASFLSGSSSSGTANVAGVATSELLSNQLSHWLSQISRDFDIGLNYRPGDEITNDELEVALSTQILDDRITINGNLGVGGTGTTQASTTTNTNNIVGDFDIDFKITENGKLHLKAFNKANDNLLFQTSPYTQGVGVFYREEFNSFGELVKKYFNAIGRLFDSSNKN